MELTYAHALCSGVHALVTNIYKIIELIKKMGKDNKNEI
jgi:hypothetical protein